MEKQNVLFTRFMGLVLAAVVLSTSAWAETYISDNFNYSDGLITNEYAFWNPQDSNAHRSPIWESDSGSFFCQGNAGWTGVPDNKNPNINSSNGNNSSVFRLNTKRKDLVNAVVSFDLLNQGLNTSPSTPAVDWDGLHIWLHYQSEYSLYYASINRRDNTVVIKKKVPGGPSNGGTYYPLTSQVPAAVPYNQWQHVKASVQNNADGTVTIKLYRNDVLLVSVTDNGTIGGPPILAAGRVGLRGDNANLKFKNFLVTSLDGAGGTLPGEPTGMIATPGNAQVTVSWSAVSGAATYNLYRSRFPGVTKANGFKVANVTSPYLNVGFTNGVRYYMVATAVNATGESAISAEVSAVPSSSPPSSPSNVTASPGNRCVTVRWNAVPGATSYNLYRSRFADVNKATGYKLASVATPKINTGFLNGTRYYFVVTAVNAAGESVESALVSAVPDASLPGASFDPDLVASAAPGGLDEARVYPNPWRIDQDRGIPITFDHLTRGTTIKIFTLAGQFVTSFTSDLFATWNLQNDSGERVASGVYICLYTNNQGQKQKGLITVIQ